MKKEKKHPTHEEVGQMLVNIYESGYLDRNKAYKMSFLKGLASGAGGVVGAAVIISLLALILSVLHYVPFVNVITDEVQKSVEQSQKK